MTLEELMKAATPVPWKMFNVPFRNEKLRQRIGPFLLVGEVSDADARLASMAPDLAAALMDAMKAMQTLHDDLLERADVQINRHTGDEIRVVNCGNGAWMGFCAALARIRELTGGKDG